MDGISNPQDLANFNLSRRHLTRLQALIAEGILCSPVLLEMVAENGAHAKLVLDMSILKNPVGLTAAHLAELQKLYLTADDPPLALLVQDSHRILCLEEEALAEKVMQARGVTPLADLGSQRLPAQSGRQQPQVLPNAQSGRLTGGSGDHALAQYGGTGQSGYGVHYGGGSGDLFSESSIQQLKLKLLTAADEGARAESLRILGLAPLEAREKTELYLKALADSSQMVRTEAARLLREQGFKTDLANALAGISAQDPEQRTYHITRLSRMLEGATEVELTGAMICLLRRIDEESEANLLKDILSCVSQALRGRPVGPGAVAEVLRATLAVFSRHNNAIIGGVRLVLQTIRAAQPGELEERLWTELTRNSSDIVRAECLSQLLQLLDARRAGGDTAQLADMGRRLARVGVEFLAQDQESGYAARNVGSVLMELPDDAVAELVPALKTARSSQVVYMLRLLDYIVRFRPVTLESKQLAGQALLHLLTRGDQQVRTAAMETTLATDPQLNRELRVELAAALLEHLKDLMFDADVSAAEGTIARIGEPAIAVLMKHLDPMTTAKQRVTAVRVLGETVRLLPAPADRAERKAYKELVETVLRQLKRLSLDADFPDPGEVDLCLGKVASSPGLDRDSIMVCARHLLQRADHTQEMLDRAHKGEFSREPLAWRFAAQSLEGLSWLCTSRNLTQTTINNSFQRFEKILAGPVPDSPVTDIQKRDVDGETLFEVGPSVEILVEIVPAAVAGTTRIALAPVGHSKLARAAAKLLTDVWRQAVRGTILLSPGNSISLVECLRDLGTSTRIPATVAIEILKNLALRKDDPQILMHMAMLAAKNPYRELIAYTVKVGMEICKHRDKNGNFDPELREFYLAGLAAAISRKDLPPELAPVAGLRREALQCLLDGMADGVPHCAENLIALRDQKVLPAHEQADLESRLRTMPVPFVREETYKW